MTNCKTAYSHCIVLLVNWKCLALQKDEWDSWETEENLLGLRKLEKYFEAVFSNFYFKLAKGKVIFLCICQKKSDQKGHLQLIFLLERNEGRGVGLCSRPSGYYACQLVCKWFILKSRLYTWRNPGMGHQCPLECLQRESYLETSILPLAGLCILKQRPWYLIPAQTIAIERVVTSLNYNEKR